MAGSYATQADLLAFAPAANKPMVPADPEATRLLTRATETIDTALKTAIYDVDSNGYPTDATLLGALKDATCAQALWWLLTGDETGVSAQWASMSIGGLSLSRGSRDTGGVGPQLCPQAATILQRAALLPGSVITWPAGWFLT
jgi:hypothetical protein